MKIRKREREREKGKTCKKEIEADRQNESYFSFLKRRRGPTLPLSSSTQNGDTRSPFRVIPEVVKNVRRTLHLIQVRPSKMKSELLFLSLSFSFCVSVRFCVERLISTDAAASRGNQTRRKKKIKTWKKMGGKESE